MSSVVSITNSRERQFQYSAATFAPLVRGRRVGPNRWIGHCPGPLHHRGDRDQSLSFADGHNGGVVLKCFVGCQTIDILAALHLTFAHISAGDRWTTPGQRRHDFRPRALTELRDVKRERYEELRKLYRETAVSFRWLAKQVDAGEPEWVSLWADDERALNDLHRELNELEKAGYRAR